MLALRYYWQVPSQPGHRFYNIRLATLVPAFYRHWAGVVTFYVLVLWICHKVILPATDARQRARETTLRIGYRVILSATDLICYNQINWRQMSMRERLWLTINFAALHCSCRIVDGATITFATRNDVFCGKINGVMRINVLCKYGYGVY